MISLPMRRMPPATLKNRVSDGYSCRGMEAEQSQAHYSQCPTPPPYPTTPPNPSTHPLHPAQPLHPTPPPYQPPSSHPIPTG